eukprot:snap_masked-scaffold_19-processed-gene-1.32-mRNA-1 protein AED:0.41 eAED:0.42 QI:0/-1/0/1/-1/1/1/0/558
MSEFTTNYLTPIFHLIPEVGQWQNDPCGAYYDDGVYYLHYQNNPFEVYWGNMHWGTYTSTDFIHWQRDEITITPGYLNDEDGDLTFDEYHAFSGSALSDGVEGNPTLFYTGITRDDLATRGLFWRLPYIEGTESQGLQYRDEEGLHKIELVANPEPEWNVTGFRDPYVWEHEDGYLMVVAGGFKGYDAEADETTYEGGAIFLYKNDGDLLDWTAQSKPFFYPQTGEAPSGIGDATFGGNIEVANYFEMEEERTGAKTAWLTISVEFPVEDRLRAVKWVKGEIIEDEDGDTVFDWQQWGYLDHGMMYAPTTLDKSGERVLFGWLDELQAGVPLALGGSSGVQGIPRTLFVQTRSVYSKFTGQDIWSLEFTKRGVQYVTMGQKPVAEIEELRGDRLYSLSAGSGRDSVSVSDSALGNAHNFEIEVTAKYAEGETVGFSVLGDGNIFTTIVYDFDTQMMTVDFSQSTETEGAYSNANEPYEYVADCGLIETWSFRSGSFEVEDLHMRVFVDGSSIEVYANDRCVTSARSFPSSEAADAIEYIGSAPVSLLRVWEYTDPIFQ